MSDFIKNGAMTIQRAQVLDCLRSLAFALYRQTPKSEYHAGYADALMSVALSIGVEEEFLTASEQVKKLLERGMK